MDDFLKIEYIPIDKLKPYENNARKHADKDIKVIVNSIKEFGFDDPIGIWGEDNIIVEGHGRVLAAKKLGMTEVPIIRLDHLTDEQRRAYALVHNKSAELSNWLTDVLKNEINNIDLDMSKFGFNLSDENPYSMKVKVPLYEPTGELMSLTDCVDTEKYDKLIKDIENSNINDTEKEFLKLSASRHIVFNYRNIAEYYASASPEMQKLMEDSALVIIDLNSAIEKGYCMMMNKIEGLINDTE